MSAEPMFADMRPTDKRIRIPSPTQRWLKSDLLFLKLSLESGMDLAEVAGFLARTEDEVREKAKELRGWISRVLRLRRWPASQAEDFAIKVGKCALPNHTVKAIKKVPAAAPIQYCMPAGSRAVPS